jgi:hypothetical protein
MDRNGSVPAGVGLRTGYEEKRRDPADGSAAYEVIFVLPRLCFSRRPPVPREPNHRESTKAVLLPR